MTSSPHAALAVLLALVWAAPAAAQAAPERGPDIGTGFVVAPGTVLTTAHDVNACSSVTVQFPNAPPAPVTTVRADRQIDLAVLSVATPASAPALTIRATDPDLGEPYAVLGYPLQPVLRPDHPTFSTGVVAGFGGPGGDPLVFRVPVVVLPGTSGAAVLDAKGQVLGIVKAHLVQSAPNNGPSLGGESFIVRASALAAFMRLQNVAPPSAPAPGPDLGSAQLAARALASSAIVTCLKQEKP